MDASPVAAHGSSPAELAARHALDRDGTPYLVWRHADGTQRLLPLGEHERVLLGRSADATVQLDWDSEVSRIHAELVRAGSAWVLADDGLSRNGTAVNGEPVAARVRLADGDVVRVGTSLVAFRDPSHRSAATTDVAHGGPREIQLTPAQRRVLVALCRPFRNGGAFAAPATNAQIAQELVLSVDAVKTHMKALFERFDVADLPASQKRLRVVEWALRSGIVQEREL